jgi:hypothetical protein
MVFGTGCLDLVRDVPDIQLSGYPVRFLLSGDYLVSGIWQKYPAIFAGYSSSRWPPRRRWEDHRLRVPFMSDPQQRSSKRMLHSKSQVNGERAGDETGRHGVTVVKHGQLAPGPTTNQLKLTARAGYWRRAGSWTT